MKLSKKDLQDKRNRNNTVQYIREVTDQRKYNMYSYYKSAHDFNNGSSDANTELLKYNNEKKNDIIAEENKIMLECFPWLESAMNVK